MAKNSLDCDQYYGGFYHGINVFQPFLMPFNVLESLEVSDHEETHGLA